VTAPASGRHRALLRFPGAVRFAVLLASCSDIPTSGSEIIALEVRPPVPAQVEAGDTLQLSARALDRNGDSVAAPLRWRTADPLNVAVDSLTGRVTGLLAGTSGRVQVSDGSLASDLIALSVVGRADTVLVPADTLVVGAAVATSPPLAVRVAARDAAAPGGLAGVGGRSVIFSIVEPPFPDAAARTVEITGDGIADTVVTGGDGFPATPVTLSRIAGRTAPAQALVEVRVLRRSGAPVPGSGQRFVVRFD